MVDMAFGMPHLKTCRSGCLALTSWWNSKGFQCNSDVLLFSKSSSRCFDLPPPGSTRLMNPCWPRPAGVLCLWLRCKLA